MDDWPSTQPCIHPGSRNRVPALIGWAKGGNVTSAGTWQVTLCDPVYCTRVPVAVRLVVQTAIHPVKLAFHDTDMDILARILADTSDTRDFLKLFLWQAERHADILATILASMSTRSRWCRCRCPCRRRVMPTLLYFMLLYFLCTDRHKCAGWRWTAWSLVWYIDSSLEVLDHRLAHSRRSFRRRSWPSTTQTLHGHTSKSPSVAL